MKRSLLCSALAAAVLAAAGCESTKSSNPLSPTVAGPLPGVNITPPRLLEPGQGWEFENAKQPITLLIENASSNGPRPLLYEFDVAADKNFTNKVFTQTNVPQGPNGRTSLKLPQKLASGRTYYWRAKAVDGANQSTYASAVSFQVVIPVVIKAPDPISPLGGATVTTSNPLFRFRSADISGPAGRVTYRLEVSRDNAFTRKLKTVTFGAQSGGTQQVRANATLPAAQNIYWRVRASDPKTTGPWSRTQRFRSSAAPAPGPEGPAPPVGSCASKDPDFIIDCVSRKYPSRLKAGVSLSTRKTNMAYLRDRIIEAGLCGGTEMGWNMKRGGPEKSIDYMVHVKSGNPWGVDIAFDYDNTSKPIRLQWLIDKITPHYRPYSNSYKCN